MTEYLDRYPTMHEYAEGKRINPKLTDLISRADAIEAVASITMSIHLSDVICDKLLALPSADAVEVDRTSEWVAVRREEYEEYLAKSADAEQTDKPNTALDEVFKESHDAFHKWEEDMYKGRPHGKWYQIKDHKIMGEGYLWHCSICDYKVYQDSSKDYPTENYCPNCGARMKGGDDE